MIGLDPLTPGSISPSFHLPRHLTRRDPTTLATLPPPGPPNLPSRMMEQSQISDAPPTPPPSHHLRSLL